MRDKLKDILMEIFNTDFKGDYESGIEDMADRLIEHNVFVLPEQMKDSWELTSAFVLRLFCSNEEEVNKMKQEFECQKVKQILTDIRDYLVTEKGRVANSDIYILQIQAVEKFADKALADLTEYAEKLGVEL